MREPIYWDGTARATLTVWRPALGVAGASVTNFHHQICKNYLVIIILGRIHPYLRYKIISVRYTQMHFRNNDRKNFIKLNFFPNTSQNYSRVSLTGFFSITIIKNPISKVSIPSSNAFQNA